MRLYSTYTDSRRGWVIHRSHGRVTSLVHDWKRVRLWKHRYRYLCIAPMVGNACISRPPNASPSLCLSTPLSLATASFYLVSPPAKLGETLAGVGKLTATLRHSDEFSGFSRDIFFCPPRGWGQIFTSWIMDTTRIVGRGWRICVTDRYNTEQNIDLLLRFYFLAWIDDQPGWFHLFQIRTRSQALIIAKPLTNRASALKTIQFLSLPSCRPSPSLLSPSFFLLLSRLSLLYFGR